MTNPSGNSYFEIKNLSAGFRTYEGIRPVLNIEGLSIERGETYGLVGESGGGKTVLALTIMGLLPKPAGIILNGEIWFDGVDLLKQTDKQMADIYRGKTPGNDLSGSHVNPEPGLYRGSADRTGG